jgi:hypothetical protein
MTAPASFASPAELSAWTGGKISAGDPRAQPLLDAASAAIRRHCGWHITPVATEVTLTLDGPGGFLLVLPTLQLVGVRSIVEAGTALADDDFEWSANGEVRRLRGHWSSRYRSIVAVVDHGFESAPELKQVVLQVCASALSSPMGATREQAGQVSVSWATTAPGVAGGLALLERDLAVVNQYRLPWRA